MEQQTWQQDAKRIEVILSKELVLLNGVLNQITKKWADEGVKNTFRAVPSIAYYMKTFRCKITIESVIGDIDTESSVNTIFYHKQRIVSESLLDYKDELKSEMNAFVGIVVAELITKAVETLRTEVITNQRERMYPLGDVPNAQVMLYPLVPNESFIKK